MRNPLGILAFLCSTLQDTMKGEVFHGFLPASFITGLIFRVLPKCGANPCGWSWDGAPEGGAELESPGPWAGLCLAWTPPNGSSLAGIPGVPGVPVPSWSFCRNPSALQTSGRDSLGQGLWSCRPGFLCCCTLPGDFSLSFYLWPLSPTLSFLSLLVSSIPGSTFIHLISGTASVC